MGYDRTLLTKLSKIQEIYDVITMDTVLVSSSVYNELTYLLLCFRIL